MDHQERSQQISARPTMPYMERTTFAALIGLPLNVVDGWIARGYVPTVKIGKNSLVNIALLSKTVLKSESC